MCIWQKMALFSGEFRNGILGQLAMCYTFEKDFESSPSNIVLLVAIICHCRLTTLQHSSTPSSALIQLLGNMVGILGIQSPSEDSSTTSMAGLMGK